MYQVQKTDIFKKLLKVIFRVVTLYASESLKAQSKYPDVYRWFERCNKLLEEEIRIFLHMNSKNTSVKIDTIHLDPSINLSLNEEDIVFIFAQSYWDSYQYEVFDYNKALFKELGIEKDQFKNFSHQTQMKLYSRFYLDSYEKIEFSKKYNFSAFVGKDRFTKVLFQYFKLLYLTENNSQLYKNIDLSAEFLKLIKIVPCFSIKSRSSIAGYKTYPTKMGKKYYAEFKLPLGVQAGALVDNMIHFIFNYLTELFYFKELRDESGNFDINLYSNPNPA